MKKIRVGVVGLGTIGKRVADAVGRFADLQLTGVGVRTPNPTALTASLKGMPLYCTDASRLELFRSGRLPVAGDLHDLLDVCDVIVDCTQAKQGAKRWKVYQGRVRYVIFQGGEKHVTTGFTFSTFGNYDQVRGKRAARVGSCNTTGLVRVLSVLDREWEIEHVEAALTRCSADPDKSRHGIPNGAAPVFGLSHHGPDLQLVLPHISIYTQAVAVPMFHSHVQLMYVKLKKSVDAKTLVDTLDSTPRILIESAEEVGSTTAQVARYYARSTRPRGDRPEVLIWKDSIHLSGGTHLRFATSIDMQSITIPETMDCIRTMAGLEDTKEACITTTDDALGIEKNSSRYPVAESKSHPGETISAKS